MRSAVGCAALRLLWLKQKKIGVPMTAHQNRPKIPLMPHHLHAARILCEIGAKSSKSPQFRPSSPLCSNWYDPVDPPVGWQLHSRSHTYHILTIIMEDNPTPPPPPAPAVARLPKLPSNAEIVRPRNADVSLLILHAVFSRGPHRPGGTTYRDVAALLWENSPVITGPLFGRFQEWAPTQIQRNMKERASTIIGHYSAFDPDEVPHPTPLQRLA
jgi:hypothetical protein